MAWPRLLAREVPRAPAAAMLPGKGPGFLRESFRLSRKEAIARDDLDAAVATGEGREAFDAPVHPGDAGIRGRARLAFCLDHNGGKPAISLLRDGADLDRAGRLRTAALSTRTCMRPMPISRFQPWRQPGPGAKLKPQQCSL